MPLASLDEENRGKYIHSPAHDLESLLHTIFGVVSFTVGPCGQIRQLDDHVPHARWYNEPDLEQLLKDKQIDLIFYDRGISNHLPDYWKPFSPYLRRLVHATWPKMPTLSESAATHDAFREILKEALEYFATTNPPETPAPYARITAPKRSRSPSGDRYPYKQCPGDVRDNRRLPHLSVIKPLADWTDIGSDV